MQKVICKFASAFVRSCAALPFAHHGHIIKSTAHNVAIILLKPEQFSNKHQPATLARYQLPGIIIAILLRAIARIARWVKYSIVVVVIIGISEWVAYDDVKTFYSPPAQHSPPHTKWIKHFIMLLLLLLLLVYIKRIQCVQCALCMTALHSCIAMHSK